MHFVTIQISLFLNVQFAFICWLSLMCVFCGTMSMFQYKKCFFQQIKFCQIYVQHSQYRGQVSNHHILFNFTFHVKATYNYRKVISSSPHHACLQSPVKMHICFWSNISAPLSCCSRIIGITVCRKQSEAPDRSMTSQTLFFCLVNPTAPSEEIQLNLSFKEYVTAGA